MKYKTVVIDPPWPVVTTTKSIKNKRHNTLKPNPLSVMPFSTMTLDEIRQFPINDFADDESLLFLWVINSKCEDTPIIKFGFDLFDKWGFTYHQIITIEKRTGVPLRSPFLPMTEHCLVGYRGNFHSLTMNQYNKMRTIIKHNHVGLGHVAPHSQKPPLFYQLLRSWTPEPRIDIFARNAHDGFDGWGDEYVGEGPLQEFLE